MAVLDILKESASQVLEQTKLIAGTRDASAEFGMGAGGDISTGLDLKAEQAVLETLEKYDFRPTVIGEECGVIKGDSGYLIMDAIDGTTNAMRGIPFYCCSLAYASDYKMSSITDAVVMDLGRGDLYTSSKDKGSFLNGERIKPDRKSGQGLQNMVVGMNISGISREVLSNLAYLLSKFKHARHFGANALELCYLARGFLDAYLDFRNKIRITDMAAAYLVVKEAGGKVYTMDGQILDSDFEENTTLSFIAVREDESYKRITSEVPVFKYANKYTPGPGFEPGSKE
jgi:myo-inositol-1(or 4)-monophosphatase